VAEPTSKAIKTLGGFELITKIGQGGMGTVFRARQISLDRDVALKILPPQIAQRDPVFIERFIREARTSAKLNHQNIVQGIEVGKDDDTGLYYFAMEFIDGVTIKALLKEERVIAEKRALEIGMGVTQALICAHRAGIVHRDIKPDNILLSTRGEPKLADLGLARQALDSDLGEGSGSSTEIFGINLSKNAELTQAGSALGTPSYMAPEQIKAEMDKIDARTDLYQLGATLYHMVTGKAPYVAENSRAVMMMHLTAPVPEARASNPDLSEAASKLILKLMQKDQTKRFQSAEELARELDRILNGAPVERLRRGSGKHLAIHGSGKQNPVGEPKPPTGDHSANRAGAGNAAKSTRQPSQGLPRNKKLLYAGLGTAGIAIAGIVFAFIGTGSRNTPGTRTITAEQHGENGGKTPAAPAGNDGNGAQIPAPGTAPTAPAKVAAEIEKWEPFDKAAKAISTNPEDYANNLKLLADAEKGAPPSVIPEIRHHKTIQERDRDVAFRKTMDDIVKKARESVGGGKADFVAALNLVKDGAIPANLLSDAGRQELAKVRGEFEAQTAAAFNGSIEGGIKRDIEKAESISRIQEIQQKFGPLAQTYPVKSVRDRLDELNKAALDRIKAINLALSQSQESTFCRSVEAAYAFAKTGEYNDAIKSLMKIHADPSIAERYGSQSEILKRDLETVRDMIKKSTETLEAKLSSKDDVLLHPLGGAVTGKIIARETDGTFTFASQDIGEQSIDPQKMDAWDVLALSGSRLEGAERKELLGVCYFWQGKPQKAYDYFAQAKKESSEGSDAGIYLFWMNSRATDLIARMTEHFRECRDNPALTAEEKKSKQAEAQAMLARLKTEFSSTEAYLARKQKK
jgi:serine/threonine protein kinase